LAGFVYHNVLEDLTRPEVTPEGEA
jgi:hypothetical protein